MIHKTFFFLALTMILLGCRPMVQDPGGENDASTITAIAPSMPRIINADTADSLNEVMRYGAGMIFDLQYSSDGTKLFLATSLGIQILDATTLVEQSRFVADSAVRSLLVSPDGRYLVALSGEGATVWALAEDVAEPLYTILPYDSEIAFFAGMAIHPKTNELWLVASANPENGETILSRHALENGSTVNTQALDVPHWVFYFAIAPIKGLVAGGYYDDEFNGDVSLWDASTGKALYVLENHSNLVQELRFSKDEGLLATASGQTTLFSELENRISLWNVVSGDLLNTFNDHESLIHRLAFAPNSSLMISGDNEGQVLLWEQNGLYPIFTTPPFNTSVTSVVFSPDGAHMAAAAEDGSIRIYRVTDKTLLAERNEANSSVTDMSATAAMGQFATSHSDGSLRLWQLGTPDPIAVRDKGRIDYELLKRREAVDSVAMSPDGRYIVGYEWLGRGYGLWYLRTEDRLSVGPVGMEYARTGQLAFAPDNSTYLVFTVKSDNALVEIWQPGQELPKTTIEETFIYEMQFNTPPLDITVSPDSMFFAYSLPTGDIVVRQLNGDEEIYRLTGDDAPATVLAFTPDGMQLLSVTATGQLNYWSMTDGMHVSEAANPGSNWRAAAFSPDGALIAAGTDNGLLIFFDATTLEEVARLEAHTASITGLAFVEEGMMLLTSAMDGTVRAWSVEP